MSYGLNILNNSNDIAFSTDYPCYSFVGKYVVARTLRAGDIPSALTSNYCSLTISSSSCPLVFVKPNNSGDSVKMISAQNNGNGTWTVLFTSVSIQSGSYGGGSNLTTLTAYVFNKDNVAATGYGINVYSAPGNINFSTARKTLKPSAKLISNAYYYSGTAIRTYDQSVFSGSIPSNWACSAASSGYLILGIDPSLNVGLAISIGVSVTGSTTVQFKAAMSVSGTPFSNAIKIMGGTYSLFIDCSLYD